MADEESKAYIRFTKGSTSASSLRYLTEYFKLFSVVESDKEKVFAEIHNLARYVKALRALIHPELLVGVMPLASGDRDKQFRMNLLRDTINACMPLSGFGRGSGLAIEERQRVWHLIRNELGNDIYEVARVIAEDEKLNHSVPDIIYKEALIQARTRASFGERLGGRGKMGGIRIKLYWKKFLCPLSAFRILMLLYTSLSVIKYDKEISYSNHDFYSLCEWFSTCRICFGISSGRYLCALLSLARP